MKNILAFASAFMLCTGCSIQSPSRTLPPADGTAFFVHLQEGFSGEPVRILVDNKVLFEGKPATDPRLGIAEGFSGSTAATNISLTIEIPDKNIKSTHNIDLTAARGIGISVLNGKPAIIQANAFGYD
jgi:hypothetical protein